MRAGRFTSRPDPGWLFIAAGLTLCIAGVLIPAQQGLDELRGQLTRIEHVHARGQDRIAALGRFLERLDDRDPAVIRRLAAAQLNLMPAGDTPVLVASSRRATVLDWIGRAVARDAVTAAPPVRTWLTRLTDGTRRLWVLGAGVLLVFVGLLVDGRPATAVADGVEWSDNLADEDDAFGDDDEDVEEEPDEEPDEEYDEDEEDYEDFDEDAQDTDDEWDDDDEEWEEYDEDEEDDDEGEDEDEEDDDAV